MADLLQPLRDLGCEIVVQITWTRPCSKCGASWTTQVEAASIEEALREALAIEAANDASPEMEKLCRRAQEDGRRG